jgi:hypothetical protein
MIFDMKLPFCGLSIGKGWMCVNKIPFQIQKKQAANFSDVSLSPARSYFLLRFSGKECRKNPFLPVPA